MPRNRDLKCLAPRRQAVNPRDGLGRHLRPTNSVAMLGLEAGPAEIGQATDAFVQILSYSHAMHVEFA
jgi:hypothetical protein